MCSTSRAFFRHCRARFGRTFTRRLPGFPPVVVTGEREAARDLFTGDPLQRGTGNELLKPLVGERSLLTLGPREHLARRRLELVPLHGETLRSRRS